MRRSVLVIAVVWSSSPCLLLASTARAETPNDEQRVATAKPRYCKDGFRGFGYLGPSEASSDLYNGMFWFGGAVVIQASTTQSNRWSRRNSFDDGIRNGLRFGSKDSRDAADEASDALLGASIAVPALGVMRTLIGDRDCEEAYDMATDIGESIGLTVFLVEAAKSISGREHPPASKADSDRSFYSGHAALAASAAGVGCSQSIRRETWGESGAAKVLPCALGITAALGTGIFRIAADHHWGSDVIVGLVVGGTVGWFDTWGPFDLLRFEIEPDDNGPTAQGVVLPMAANRTFGAHVLLQF